jgi:hypothetical protein
MRIIRIITGIIWLLLLPGMLTPSCETNREELIPYVKVDEYLLLYADLADMGIGTTKLIDGGWRGIVLYRETDLVFYAFDRTCTRFPDHDVAVVEDPNFFGVFECPVCHSTYLLMNGAEPNSGPAQFPLVQYNTSIQGDVLHIFN